MTPGSAQRPQDDDRLQVAIDRLADAVRAGRSGNEESAALKELVAQLRSANQHLVLASVRAQVLQEEAEARNRQQNEFLAMLAHELRNPMAPISNAASLLAKITAAHPILPEIQGVISRQVEHMAHLIDDLLDASRITTGKVTLQKSRITVNEVVSRAVEMVRPSIEQRGQQLVVDPMPAALPIEGDLTRLSQALSNLLVNASKFTPEQGRVDIGIAPHADRVHLSVRDNGVGIEPDLLPYIFDFFRQGPRSLARSEGGLGIGLSVAKGLVELHGGTISVRSEGAGTGAQFEIALPVLDHSAPEPASAPGPVPAIGSRRILLIEDNADTNATLKMLLELQGHQVAAALDGLTGLSLATSFPHDVILCDIGLPGMDGYGVMTQVRQQAVRPRPFAIALSGYGQPEDRARALEAGFDEYIVKPVKSDYLLYLIGSLKAPV